MDEFYQGLIESLGKAKEKRERLLKELEVTDFLIQAQEQALSLYNGTVDPSNLKKIRAKRGDKTDIIMTTIGLEIFGISRDRLYERVKDQDIDRNYLSKVLFRLKDKGKIREDEAGDYYVV